MKKDCSECKHFDEFHTSRACHDCKPWKSSTDYISRADAIEAVRKCVIQDVGDWAMLVDKAEAILALNALPSAEAYFTDGNKIAEWIPCSERLPSITNGEVLATTMWGEITIADRFSMDKWFIHEGNSNAVTSDILAWMPLPKPYREGGEA